LTAAFVAGVGIARLTAQQAQKAPAVKRTILLKQDMRIPGREAVLAKSEILPGGSEGRHTHFPEVYGFVDEGELTLAVEGQPTRTFKAGEVFSIGPGLIHEGRNKTNAPVRLSVVFVAEKGKPLVTQVQ